MEYKQQYKNALEKARELLSCCIDDRDRRTKIYRVEDIESIFPELKEPEDERIRKAILELVRQSSEILDRQNQNNMIAWLEKQSEVTKTSDQKLEPKFHSGDWVIDNVGKIYQIEKAFKSIAKDIFGYTIVGGGYLNDNDDVRLWTIQDAKDGDVLAVNSMPFIYNGNKNEVTVGAYCGFTEKHIFSFAYNYAINQNITPATKEQCDRLFAKMRESGHEWDAEKKELKKMKVPSEDERMKKAIKHVLYENYTDAAVIEGVEIAEIIAWLEEQGQTFTKKDVDDAYLQGICDAKHEIEKQGEKDPCIGYVNDKGCVTCENGNLKEIKFEPKFHPGDWIVGDEGTFKIIFKITQYEDEYGYELTSTTGYIAHFVSPDYVESNYHLWTLQDVKDGDVLYCKAVSGTEFIMVFKNITRNDILNSYCRYNSAFGFSKNVSSVMSVTDDPKPATKEQRDLLFQKMKDAGYEWDAERKELKKIES